MRGHLIDFKSSERRGDAGPDTDTPTGRGRLKKAPLVSKQKKHGGGTQKWRFVTCRLRRVVQPLSGITLTPIYALFKVISFQGGCAKNILSIRSPLNCFPFPGEERHSFCPPDWPLLCLYLCSWKSIPSSLQSFFFGGGGGGRVGGGRVGGDALLLSIPEGSTEPWAHKLCCFVSASPCFTFTLSHTLLSAGSWITELLSSSTGADGIKGKGCWAAFVLFIKKKKKNYRPAYRCLKLCLVTLRLTSTNGALIVRADRWSWTCITDALPFSFRILLLPC